jgi:O-antigen/teichoic acid export membrane protein
VAQYGAPAGLSGVQIMAARQYIASPRSRLHVHPVLRDLSVTTAACFTNFVAGLTVIAIFGHLLGVVLLSEYLLLRRIAGWLLPLAHLGLGVGLPRYIAYATEDQEPQRRQLEYFVAGAVCIFGCVAVLGLISWAGEHPLSRVLFGNAQLSGLMLPLLLLLSGGAAQAVVYGFYRGCLKMKHAAALQVCISVVPILTAISLFRTRSVTLIVSLIGCAMIAVAGAFAMPIVRQLRRTPVPFSPRHAAQLLTYGVSRVPGDLSTGALLALGPVFALHYLPVARVSSLLLAISMLSAVAVSTEPLGVVFLSKLSMMLAEHRQSEVRMYLSHLISATVDLSLFVTLQLMIFADLLVRTWVGANALDGVVVIRTLLMAIPFYVFFTAFRSALDAGSIHPLNAHNLIVVLAVFVGLITLCSWLVPRPFLLHAIAMALVLVLILLAYLTRASLARLFQVRPQWKESFWPMSCALALGGAGLVYATSSDVSLLHWVAVELLFAATFIAVCSWSGAPWVQFLWARMFRPAAEAEPAPPLRAERLG